MENFGNNGLAKVAKKDGGQGYINREGKEIVPCEFSWLEFSNDGQYIAAKDRNAISVYNIYGESLRRDVPIDDVYWDYNYKNFKEYGIFKYRPIGFTPLYYVSALDKEFKTESLALAALAKATPPKPKYPPMLNIKPGSIVFADASGNNAIDANEASKIRFTVTNSGKGSGINCVAKIATSAAGINVSDQKLPEIPAGKSITVEIPVKSSLATVDGTAKFNISVYEPNGFGSDPTTLTIDTKSFDAPLVKVTDYAILNAADGKIAKRSSFDLQLLVQNTKHGKAENVEVEISVPSEVWVTGETKKTLGTLAGGSSQEIVCEMMVSGNYAANTIPVQINIKEKHGKYAVSESLSLPIGERLAANVVSIQSKRDNSPEGGIELAQLGNKTAVSDVDVNIPKNSVVNDLTFALVVANENYQEVSPVANAINDGKIFAEYCTSVLGLPQDNVHFVADATFMNLRREVNWLKQVARAYDGEAKIIVYYAGHGIPDESTHTSYLLPVDGMGTDISTGLSLKEFYATLSDVPARAVTVFLDACFSGATRDGGMMAAARGVAIKAKPEAPQGNLVVLSAAQGDETAYPYKEQNHGLFTYYLLKKLQQTHGDVTIGELSEYITENVSRKSIVVNGKSQTPTLNASVSLGNSWKLWKLK